MKCFNVGIFCALLLLPYSTGRIPPEGNRQVNVFVHFLIDNKEILNGALITRWEAITVARPIVNITVESNKLQMFLCQTKHLLTITKINVHPHFNPKMNYGDIAIIGFEGPVLTETGLIPELDGLSHSLNFDISMNSEINIVETECNSHPEKPHGNINCYLHQLPYLPYLFVANATEYFYHVHGGNPVYNGNVLVGIVLGMAREEDPIVCTNIFYFFKDFVDKHITKQDYKLVTECGKTSYLHIPRSPYTNSDRKTIDFMGGQASPSKSPSISRPRLGRSPYTNNDSKTIDFMGGQALLNSLPSSPRLRLGRSRYTNSNGKTMDFMGGQALPNNSPSSSRPRLARSPYTDTDSRAIDIMGGQALPNNSPSSSQPWLGL